MKAILGWLARIVAGAITIVLVIVLLPHFSRLAAQLLPDVSGSAIKTSAVLASKLQNSARLETMTVCEEGVIDERITILGNTEIGSISVKYQYNASFGIDLQKVTMQVTGDTITFLMPEPELLQDSLTPLETYRDDFWVVNLDDNAVQKLINDERAARTNTYLMGENADALWQTTIRMFEETIGSWMKNAGNGVTLRYEKAAIESTAE